MYFVGTLVFLPSRIGIRIKMPSLVDFCLLPGAPSNQSDFRCWESNGQEDHPQPSVHLALLEFNHTGKVWALWLSGYHEHF